MSQIIKGILTVSFILVLTACGSSTPNKDSVFISEESHGDLQEVLEWHPAAAKANVDACTECHGADLTGGISGVSCATQCHLGGAFAIHPLSWGTNVVANHQAYADANGTSSCANAFCHGVQLQGVQGSGPSCSTCHPF
jgi:hypothetical protein